MNKTKSEIEALANNILDQWEKKNNPFYPSEMRRDKRTMFEVILYVLEYHQTENSNVEGNEERENNLVKESVKYAQELISSKAIKDYEQSWLESVFLYVAKSDAARQYHSSKKDVDLKAKYVNHFGNKVNYSGEEGDFTSKLLYEIYDWFELNYHSSKKEVDLESLEKDIHKLYNAKCYINPNNVFRDIINLIEYYKTLQSDNSEVERLNKSLEYLRTCYDLELINKDNLEKQLSEHKGSDAVEFAEWKSDYLIENPNLSWTEIEKRNNLSNEELYQEFLKSKEAK